MSATLREGRKLSMSEKLSRLRKRLRDPEWRQYGKILLGGKALGVGLVILLVMIGTGKFFTSAYAADAPIKAGDVINPVNTVWTLIAAFLVFGCKFALRSLEPVSGAAVEPSTGPSNAWETISLAAFSSTALASRFCSATAT